ncbi:MAG: sigma-54 dependent transcriptional regulator [Candidatus Aerophobetes bacterium]|nr:sigma-54 dependent transcriptional regulator [Candidatus Aerophobetes bacterium]
MKKILLVDDEPHILELLSVSLEGEGYRILTANNGKEAVTQVEKEKPHLALVDIRMPDMDGMKVLHQIKEINKATSVIIMTAYGAMNTVVEAMKLGAYDYITKPIDMEKLKDLIKRALEAKALAGKVAYRENPEEKYKLENIVGKTSRMFEVYKRIGKVVNNKATVLIRGETGTGKELVARAIHFNGILKNGPFVAVDCASLPEDLLESEFFGHEKGAFTGAITQKLGKFELASRGTLFLDEIGNLNLATQAKLLRVLQEKRIERVGGTKPIKINVRIITATHRNLEKAVREGVFREDLYYRLNVVIINLPPLKERKEDIPLLVEHFLRRCGSELAGRVKYVPPETMDFLIRYGWPGNARELENVIERGVVMGKGGLILPQDLPSEIQKTSDLSRLAIPSPGRLSLKERVALLEKELIINALEETGWIQIRTAKLLGISRRILKYKMEKYEIKKTPSRKIKKNQ